MRGLWVLYVCLRHDPLAKLAQSALAEAAAAHQLCRTHAPCDGQSWLILPLLKEATKDLRAPGMRAGRHFTATASAAPAGVCRGAAVFVPDVAACSVRLFIMWLSSLS